MTLYKWYTNVLCLLGYYVYIIYTTIHILFNQPDENDVIRGGDGTYYIHRFVIQYMYTLVCFHKYISYFYMLQKATRPTPLQYC